MPNEDRTTETRDHLIMKGGYYYRPNRAGYTKEISAAGRYTKAEAEQEASVEPWHMQAIPVPHVIASDETRETAWLAYQDRLGNLTSREESMTERAFKAGWSARDPAQVERAPLNLSRLQEEEDDRIDRRNAAERRLMDGV